MASVCLWWEPSGLHRAGLTCFGCVTKLTCVMHFKRQKYKRKMWVTVRPINNKSSLAQRRMIFLLLSCPLAIHFGSVRPLNLVQGVVISTDVCMSYHYPISDFLNICTTKRYVPFNVLYHQFSRMVMQSVCVCVCGRNSELSYIWTMWCYNSEFMKLPSCPHLHAECSSLFTAP